jgi:vacuolar-type H+-ATPase subunit H
MTERQTGPQEQAGPLGERLTAEMVRRTTFPTVHWGGVNADAVDSFLRHAAREIELLTKEKRQAREDYSMMSRENEMLRANGTRPADSAQTMAPPDQAVWILQRAQLNADQKVADGSEQQQRLVEDGERRRRALIADGQSKATRMIEHAIEEAGREAARVAAQAPLDEQRQLAYYKTMKDSVKAGLTSWIAALQGMVDTWEEAERNGAGLIPAEARAVPPPPPPVPLA